MSKRDEYIQKMRAALEELNAEIAILSEKAGKVTADAKIEFREQIEALKEKQAQARQKIEEFQHAGEGAREDMKAGFELAWIALGEALDSARSRFK